LPRKMKQFSISAERTATTQLSRMIEMYT
jgi:hypothetical protein